MGELMGILVKLMGFQTVNMLAYFHGIILSGFKTSKLIRILTYFFLIILNFQIEPSVRQRDKSQAQGRHYHVTQLAPLPKSWQFSPHQFPLQAAVPLGLS